MSHKIIRRLLAPIVALVTVLGMSLGLGVSTASATTYSGSTFRIGVYFAGNGYHYNEVEAGTHLNGGSTPSFCIDFGGSTPNHAGTIVLGSTKLVPHMTATQSAEAKFIANEYVWTDNRNDAADAALAIWRLSNNSQFNGWYSVAKSRGVISAWRQGQVNAILANAAQHAPYKMSVTISHQYVGQRGSGTATVLGSNGRPAVNRKVWMSVSGGTVLSTGGVAGRTYGYTDKYGHVAYTYQRTANTTVTAHATVTGPSSSTATLSISSYGHQRTLGGGYGEKASATAGYLVQAGMSITSACDTNCDGISTVTFRYCNPSGAKTIAWNELKGTTSVATLRVAPGTCLTKQVRLGDGTKLVSTYCYTNGYIGGCATSTVTLPKVFEVVCPAWEQASITISCGCTSAKALVTFVTPLSPRYYTGMIVIGNAAGTLATQSYTLSAGPQVIPVPWTVSSGVTLQVLFSVYRDAAHTQPLLVNKSLVKITVNSTASAGNLSVKTLQQAKTGSVLVNK